MADIERGQIDAEDFVGNLLNFFLWEDANLKDAPDVAALIPPALRVVATKQINTVLCPEYIGRFICSGEWSKDDQREADLRVTAIQRAWAGALKPFFS